jgi:hypothetical protein
VSYELGGRFGISREQMTIVQGQPQQGWVLSAFDAHTSLTVGSPPGGAKLALNGLQGGVIVAQVNGKTGFSGSLQVGEVALTKADKRCRKPKPCSRWAMGLLAAGAIQGKPPDGATTARKAQGQGSS